MPRRFRVVATNDQGHQIMTGITVDLPDAMQLWEPDNSVGIGRRITSQALGYTVGIVAKEFARYAASECVLAVSYEADKK